MWTFTHLLSPVLQLPIAVSERRERTSKLTLAGSRLSAHTRLLVQNTVACAMAQAAREVRPLSLQGSRYSLRHDVQFPLSSHIFSLQDSLC